MLFLTPLKRGAFSDVFPYPTIDQQQTLWQKALKTPQKIPEEIESNYNYPAGSFLLLVPFLAHGIPDIRIINALFLLTALAYTIWRAESRMRIALIAAVLISLELANMIFIGETVR